MKTRATIANALWWLSSVPAWRRFKRALRDPETSQQAILKRLIAKSTDTAFGQTHRFKQIKDHADFRERVPIRDYSELEPWIDRIRNGESNVLSADRVIRLATTSGTTRAKKYIPYTKTLQEEFNAAIGAWMCDLFHTDPLLMAGSSYWSITPVIRQDKQVDSDIPVGFEEDSEYLGGIRKRLVEWTMAVPSHVRHAESLDRFRATTLDHLQRRRDLRLISIWHPSFLNILLSGNFEMIAKQWPNLRLVSCWADGPSAPAAEELRRKLPGIRIQPKGLIATEGIISVPFAGHFPLAITSHFLEFIDDAGKVHLAHDLIDGESYEVILTTGGGLWRYKLNDIVQVNGFLANTPSIRFVGKSGNISDLRGEKLSEVFVSIVLTRLRADGLLTGPFAMIAPQANAYVLYAQTAIYPHLLIRLDQLLRDNPHYAYCRDLGQLAAPRAFLIENDANAAMLTRLSAAGMRLGDIKPIALSAMQDWHKHFAGHFLEETSER